MPTKKRTGIIAVFAHRVVHAVRNDACPFFSTCPDNSGRRGTKRPSAAMMAKLAGHVWSFDELFDEVLEG